MIIADEFNNGPLYNRTAEVLKNKYHNLKKRTRKYFQSYQQRQQKKIDDDDNDGEKVRMELPTYLKAIYEKVNSSLIKCAGAVDSTQSTTADDRGNDIKTYNPCFKEEVILLPLNEDDSVMEPEDESKSPTNLTSSIGNLGRCYYGVTSIANFFFHNLLSPFLNLGLSYFLPPFYFARLLAMLNPLLVLDHRTILR